MWNEGVMATLRYHSRLCLEGLNKAIENLTQDDINGLSPTQELLNLKQES